MAKQDYLVYIYHKWKINSANFFNKSMKKSLRPSTKSKNPEPKKGTNDWVIWAAWADRVTFEEIKEKSGFTENQVIKIMRKSIKPSSFRLWRKRVNSQSIKHRKKFEYERKIIKYDY